MAGRSTAHERPTPALITPKAAVGMVLVAIALTFIVQNRQLVGILLFIPTVFAPLWVALGGVFVVGLAAGYLLAWRRR